MPKAVKVEVEAGPPKRGGDARVANPAGFDVLRELLERVVPTLTGTLVGTMNGLGRAGRFQKWNDLDSAWKALVFATASGIATGVAHQLEDEDARQAMRDVAVITWAFAVSYGVERLFTKLMTKKPDLAENKAGSGLTPYEVDELGRMMDGDAAQATEAVRELIDARPDIEATASAAEQALTYDDDDEMGEILFDAEPIEMGEVLIDPTPF